LIGSQNQPMIKMKSSINFSIKARLSIQKFFN
jgi:hypothetical protein